MLYYSQDIHTCTVSHRYEIGDASWDFPASNTPCCNPRTVRRGRRTGEIIRRWKIGIYLATKYLLVCLVLPRKDFFLCLSIYVNPKFSQVWDHFLKQGLHLCWTYEIYQHYCPTFQHKCGPLDPLFLQSSYLRNSRIPSRVLCPFLSKKWDYPLTILNPWI